MSERHYQGRVVYRTNTIVLAWFRAFKYVVSNTPTRAFRTHSASKAFGLQIAPICPQVVSPRFHSGCANVFIWRPVGSINRGKSYTSTTAQAYVYPTRFYKGFPVKETDFKWMSRTKPYLIVVHGIWTSQKILWHFKFSSFLLNYNFMRFMMFLR